MPAKLDLAASRNVDPWAPTIDLLYGGGDLPVGGASVRLQVRLYPGAPGAPLLDLSAVPFEDASAATASNPDRRRLRLLPSAPASSLEGWPTGLNKPEPGEADRYSYDVILTYAGGAGEDKLALGYFHLEPGVTM
jgi:hypothetical protein